MFEKRKAPVEKADIIRTSSSLNSAEIVNADSVQEKYGEEEYVRWMRCRARAMKTAQERQQRSVVGRGKRRRDADVVLVLQMSGNLLNLLSFCRKVQLLVRRTQSYCGCGKLHVKYLSHHHMQSAVTRSSAH